MKLLTWNVRGLNAPNKQCIFKCCIAKFNPEIFLIQETKLNNTEMTNLNKKLGIREIEGQTACGASGGFAIIWDPRLISFKLISKSPN